MGSRVSHRDWQLMHVLAAWSVASIALAIGFSTAYPEQVANTAESIAALSPFWLVARILVGLGAVAAIWLWLRMVGDYIRHRPSQFRTAWELRSSSALSSGHCSTSGTSGALAPAKGTTHMPPNKSLERR